MIKTKVMVTRENLEWSFINLGVEKIEEILNLDGDYVLMEVSTFNTGITVELTSLYYDEDVHQDAVDSGQLFCDKDGFLVLIEENSELELFTLPF